MSLKQVFLLGVDISAYVLDMGDIVETKDAMLSRAQLISGECQVIVDNSKGIFSPFNSGGMLKTAGWYNSDLQVYKDGALVFAGKLKAPANASARSRRFTLIAENAFALAADRTINFSASKANPATLAKSILNACGLGDFVDETTFNAAAGAAARASATISVDNSKGLTALKVLSSISDICSISFVASGDTITAKAWAKYQGSNAGLRQAITDSNAISFGDLAWDREAFANQIVFQWGDDKELVVKDQQSERREKGLRSNTIRATEGTTVFVEDEASARFFAGQALERSAFRRATMAVTLGPEFTGLKTGQRFPVTCAEQGLVLSPFEVIEVSQKLKSDISVLRLVTLPEPA